MVPGTVKGVLTEAVAPPKLAQPARPVTPIAVLASKKDDVVYQEPPKWLAKVYAQLFAVTRFNID
jgi:hypothetical protein